MRPSRPQQRTGRRGSAWVKVKPVHTLDLVVLAVEWGSGRRRCLERPKAAATAPRPTSFFRKPRRFDLGLTAEPVTTNCVV